MNNNNDNNLILGIGLLSKITNKGIAIKIVKESSLVFIAFGIYQGVYSYLANFNYGLIDAVFYIVLGLILYKSFSKIVAIILLLMSMLDVGITVSNLIGYTEQGGSNIIFATIVILVAFRAVEATLKLDGKIESET